MIDSHQEELFIEPRSSMGRWAIGGVAALVITALVFVGYTYIRRRHALSNPSQAQAISSEPKAPPKALILVDDATLQGNKSVVGGTVKNISKDPLSNISVELELKRRKDGVPEQKLIALEPAHLEPDQEGRYSLELKAQDYSSARLVGLKAGPASTPLAFTTAQGKKRAPERLESKTITVDKRSTKRDEFLNSPDKPARVP